MKDKDVRRVKAKIIICGGRHFDNYVLLKETVDAAFKKYDLTPDSIEIVSGHCEGADRLGEKYAEEQGIKCSIFPAEWRKYGRSAGPIRNSQMIKYLADVEVPIVIGFVSSKTKGTLDTLKKATKCN